VSRSDQEHKPVMLDEVLQSLPEHAELLIDGTFGRGGHTRAILQAKPDTRAMHVFDRDVAAIAVARDLQKTDARVQVHHANYSELTLHLSANSGDAVLLDLGVSSPQLDQAERGFSFQNDGPLDMRMDQSRGQSAREWIQSAGETEILRVLREYGEEPDAKRVAAAIWQQREQLTRTLELANLVQSIKGRGKPGRHPATQVFQALRMAVNQELQHLLAGLQAAFDVLRVGGRLIIISFHSLEDRIVKQFFQQRAKAPAASRRDFMAADTFTPSLKLLGKLRADDAECQRNPRARSAVLRVAEKLA
jgi:16S rRNA (cytosine1402-N4)-methyltransferase